MSRQDFVDWFAGIFRIGSFKSTASDGQSSTTTTLNEAPFDGQEVFGLASVLERPQDGAECVYVDLGDECVVIATKDRRWQIPLAKGEVVVRAMGAATPAYVKLKPDGTAEIHATRIDLGAANLVNSVAMANLVTAQLNALKTAIGAATTVTGDGGSAFKAALVASLTAWPASVASTKVRAQ